MSALADAARGGAAVLPPVFSAWFARRGWALRDHQRALIETAERGRSVLLIAPTGAGKTLAGFLPTLIELQARPVRRNSLTPRGIHTLYVSPLKALAVDIARNLETPVREMGLAVRVETRTGDTPVSRRERQRRDPPDILLTTPEQVALMLASKDAENFFGELKRVVFDELHSLVPTKRGDLLSLGFARMRALAPDLQAVGLSATVRDPDELRRWLVSQPLPPTASQGRGERDDEPPDTSAPDPSPDEDGEHNLSELVVASLAEAAPPIIRILETAAHLPWSGHLAEHAMPEIYAAIGAHKLTLVFVNTRMQAEFVFQMLWAVNEDGLRIALHHGSLDVSQRRRVEDAMGRGEIDAVVCTATLDLGIDWGDVDLVINVGAPKGASRLLQRIGRANHRLDEPSQALLVPGNRFEVMECRAAVDAAYAGAQDAAIAKTGAIDVLAQHILGMAVSAPSTRTTSTARLRPPSPTPGSTGRRSTTASPSWPPAATR